MIKVFRIRAAATSPRLTVTDGSAGDPADWVRGIGGPDDHPPRGCELRVLAATADRPPADKEFCHLTDGALVVACRSLDDGTGPNNMYYALWYGGRRVDLNVGGAYYVCSIPTITVEPDPAGVAPCRVDGLYASVFRIAGRPPTDVYCTAGVIEGDEFVPIYESDGFSGLDFELVWSGDAP